ncbi:MAG: site-2 protease family protein [Oscillospiraceae bacterium]|nr:site-2 protease family protein [Oscillospiraceae bacterium]
MSSLLYWVLAVLMFGVIIMLHELGHFWAARATGVGVMEFAVGMGPKIWSRKAKSGVVYSLRALPLGGFCRFVGEEEDGQADRPDAFVRQKVWKRALISVAGPLTNIITAFLMLMLLFWAVGLPIGAIPEVGGLLDGLPAESAGIQVGDKLTGINGQAITTVEEASQLILTADGGEIALSLERDGEPVTIRVTPQWVEEEQRAMIGIEYVQGAPVRFPLGESLGYAVSTTGEMSVTIVRLLGELVFKGEGMEDLTGPIGTVALIRDQTEQGGIYSYLNLAALISINLAVFNLIPIPGLDGSKLIFLALEKIRGKRLNPQKEGLVTLIGLALMMGVMFFAIYQDIMRLAQ